MTTPRWLGWNLFPGSACDDFIYQLRALGVAEGEWKGAYKGAQLLDLRHWPADKDYSFNADGTCEVKDLAPWFLDQIGEWAAKFLLTYDGGEGKLLFNVDNGHGTKRMDLSVAVDWARFCDLMNHGGISFGIGNFDPSHLLGKMFDDCRSLSWDDGLKQITVHFEDGAEIPFTPAKFVKKAVDATADRFRREFGSWVWIYQKSDGWMKQVSWDEFNALLNANAAHTTEVQANHLQKSYGEHEDFYQTEVKIAFEDGSALYGAAGGTDENAPFIKSALGYKGKWCDEYTFNLPVPLLACYLWY